MKYCYLEEGFTIPLRTNIFIGFFPTIAFYSNTGLMGSNLRCSYKFYRNNWITDYVTIVIRQSSLTQTLLPQNH